MSIFKITAIRSKDIVWSGGTFKKFEVRTDQTGQEIIELSVNQKRAEKVKVGDSIEGYIEDKTFNSKAGPVTVKVLKGITAEYVYKLLLRHVPNIESVPDAVNTETTTVKDSFGEVPPPVEEGIDF